MNTTMLIKIDKKLKENAQKTAKELGLPMSTLINNYLREFVEKKEVTFSLSPNKQTVRAIKEARADFDKNKLSKFSNVQSLSNFLEE